MVGRPGTVGFDSEALEASLRRLDGLTVDQTGLGALTTEVVAAAQHLFEVAGAGLMVADETQSLRYVTASDETGQILEDGQQRSGDGPCLSAYILDRPVWTADLPRDTRWPRLRPLLDGVRVGGVLSVPVRFGGVSIGTLDVYTDQPKDWQPAEIAGLNAYAAVIEKLLAVGLAVHRGDALTRQLQFALDYRVAIERAIGFVMARDRVDAVTAFNLLRATARSSRRKIGEVARDTVDSREPPAE